MAVALLMLPAVAAGQENQEPPEAETPAAPAPPDTMLPQISAALQGATTRDISILSKALRAPVKGEGTAPGAADNQLEPVGDLDGDGVPEVLLRWAVPDVAPGGEVVPTADSRPLWSLYLLSWDGARWKASRLAAEVEDFTALSINLVLPLGRCLAVIPQNDRGQTSYPVLFRVKDHTAAVLWDAQADDSRYEPLLQGQVTFRERAGSAAEMIVTGRADPGLLRVSPNGRRGFYARAVYHWDGKAFTPAKTDYTANEDYTIYRFISALHLHDYRSAYALVAPAEFLEGKPATLDAFRAYVQDHWPEFPADGVFEAPEPQAGAPDDHLFVLSQPDRRYVYHPAFSRDGKFLLTGLTRVQEASEP